MSFALHSLTVLFLLWQVASAAQTTCTNEFVKAIWYMPSDEFPPNAISWGEINTAIYAFATLDADCCLTYNQTSLSFFVEEANTHGVAAHVSIGGWDGSRFFSSCVANRNNRTAFVQAVADLVMTYKIDGVNFDWEYPGSPGIGCNVFSPNDTQNYLAFIEDLRAHPVGCELTITAATPITPFLDASGKPSKDMSGFAKVLDFIIVMAYDIWGSWSPSVGPNAPLNDTCAAPANQVGSAVSAVAEWNAAGVSNNRIVLGVPAYGHSFRVSPQDAFPSGSTTDLAQYPKFNRSEQPDGDSQSSPGGTDVCGVTEPPGGTFNFWGLVDGGFLNEDGNPAPGISYHFDNCSKTPYVYNATSGVMVSYDNPESFYDKGEFIVKACLRGFAMWQASGDYNGLLLNSIRSALGLGA